MLSTIMFLPFNPYFKTANAILGLFNLLSASAYRKYNNDAL